MKSKPLSYKSFKADLVGDNEVAGIACAYGNIDSYGDILVKGSCTRTINSGKPIRFLAHHDTSKPIGKIVELKDTPQGMFFRAEFSKSTLGQEIRQDLMDGVVDSFSIGYRPVKEEPSMHNGRQVNLLKEINIHEISVVSIPANELAVMAAVKSSAQGVLSDENQAIMCKMAQFLISEQNKEVEPLERIDFKSIAEMLSKSGARNNAADRETLKNIHDAVVGLMNDPEDEDADEQEDEDENEEDCDDEFAKSLDEASFKLKLNALADALRTK